MYVYFLIQCIEIVLLPPDLGILELYTSFLGDKLARTQIPASEESAV